MNNGIVMINGIEYIPKNNNNETSIIKIVLLQRGWVMVGRFQRDGNDCKLFDSYTIRKWGTDKGLGQLANEGKLSETILDKNNGVVEFDYLTVIATINCEAEKWEKIL